MEKNIAVKVDHVSKSFRLPTDVSQSLRTTLVNVFKGVKGYTEQKVLEDIDFEVNKGDFFGIVGRNGSGKSTLLKIISQIYVPEKGNVAINGKLVSFIELGVGFNPELTGRENVYLNGALLGFSTKEIDGMYEEIVEFAELRDFMHQKLKNYSSGMQVRLAFSVAIKAKSDVLILDEVLAVGDEAFQRKCFDHFAQLKKENKTVILVTHDMGAVQNFCNRAILINDGQLEIDGTPLEVAKRYRELNRQNEIGEAVDEPEETRVEEAEAAQRVKLNSKVAVSNEQVIFDLNFESKVDIDDPVVTFVLMDPTGRWIYRYVTDEKMDEKQTMIAGQSRNYHIELENIFPDGKYTSLISVKKRDRSEEYANYEEATPFEIISSGSFPNDKYWKISERITLS
ncbi:MULTISPECIES: polysaccharide ABC transporter ATP-binding protein [unclassified Enterococcus]|uniref:ABC transporter ATP-binding protein n=1 Tax=unclassified Enterococcus TaxID=2608891 RepID=UPI0015569289|nr:MULTISPECIES: polysaccharide ABC transporter ATP-binding protein [unclassified Enterococcus]MBS7577278.1 ATP-binding cassette domain-containing protein [Enterococcus sp. MMGLQ5-2]MBS7584629.1 ATP-binding cassette domain-containing protein [Enterococcus sp. MMGLQ5-1]NPD12484.1 ATP-binding cassette domain-containing protein [Enterococcus sp. MMGLQ5-1]NPD37112.1 ATP-binding cassette domain-containing protein [Enterococcus sp. MMGLQ5-2]